MGPGKRAHGGPRSEPLEGLASQSCVSTAAAQRGEGRLAEAERDALAAAAERAASEAKHNALAVAAEGGAAATACAGT